MDTKALREERARLVNQAREILQRAESEDHRILTSEEQTEYDRLDAQADALKATYERYERQDEIEQEMSRSQDSRKPLPARPSTVVDTRNVHTQIQSRDRDDALRAWLICGSDRNPSDDMRDAARRCGIDPQAKKLTVTLDSVPLYQRAMGQLRGAAMLDYEIVNVWQNESRERRQNETTPGSAGGFTIGDEAIRELEIALLRFGGMRQVAQVFRTTTGAALPWPTLDDTTNEGRILGESVQVTQTPLTFGQVVLNAFKYSSDMVLASVEFLQDSSISASQVIGQALGQRIGRITNRHFTVGTGSNEPNGIVTAATLGVTAADGTTITAEELIDLLHSVDPDYRNNARWMMHDTTIREIKKLRTGAGGTPDSGNFLWTPGLAVREPDTILGYPYVVNQHMPVMAADARAVIFGDLSKYKIRDVREVTLLRLDERFADFHQVAWLAFSRHDGDLVDAGTNPVKYLQMGLS